MAGGPPSAWSRRLEPPDPSRLRRINSEFVERFVISRIALRARSQVPPSLISVSEPAADTWVASITRGTLPKCNTAGSLSSRPYYTAPRRNVRALEAMGRREC